LKEKKEKSLQFRKNEIQKKKTNFERTLIERTTYPGFKSKKWFCFLTTVIPKMRTKAKDPSPMTMTAIAQSGSPDSSDWSVAGADNSRGTTEKRHFIKQISI
jgi:hypothetical protein